MTSYMRRACCFSLASFFGIAFLLLSATQVWAQAPAMGAAKPYAVLGGSTVTNTGSSVITGDLGLSPGLSVTGFPPGTVSGTIHAGDATAAAAQVAVTTAYNTLTGAACTQDLTGQDLGGMTLTAGVYCFSTSAQLTGTLTLNAQGNSAAVFIFKIGSTLTTASGASVQIINGGTACNTFWQVGSSATLGSTTTFSGTIIAQASITLNTGAGITGRALARTGAVTLDTNIISAASCNLAPGCPVISLTPTTLANAVLGVAYSRTFTSSGGTAPYTFSVSSGTLPTGLSLTAGGVLAGTPTANGTYTFMVRATDNASCFAETTYSVVVTTSVPTLPQTFAIFLGLGLLGVGIVQMRRRTLARNR